jgi:CRP-like cAMP-binding protein
LSTNSLADRMKSSLEQKIKFLQRVPFFTELSEESVKAMVGVSFQKNFQKEDAIFQQGDTADGMYVILFGEVDVIMDGEKIATLSTDDFFGEIAIITTEPRTATVQTTSADLSLLFLPKDIFDKVKKDLSSEFRQEVLRRIKENCDRKKTERKLW